VTFRRRIILAMLPLVILLLVLGGIGTMLIYRLGDRIDRILHENYDSVVYMRDLNEVLERIDSAFQFALAGREQESRQQYEDNWKPYEMSLAKEQQNITVPGEADLVDKLAAVSLRYHQQGEAFFASPGPARDELYFGRQEQTGLYATFREIKAISGEILRMNEDNMEQANQEARRLARSALVGYGGGLALGVGLALLLIASTLRTVLHPIRAVTESATAIGAGNLDQLVPFTSADELGQLASAFNTMTRQLRDYRRSHKAQLRRAQQTSQATIDSFPDPVLVVDQQQYVELVNPVARRVLGVLPPEEGQRPSLVWQPPEPLRQPLADVLHNQREYLPEGFENAIVLPIDDEPHTFLPRILPIRDPDGVTLGAAILLSDITRFRLLDEFKSNLVATVSHELKTPLTSIRLVLHLLLEEQVGPLNPKQLELLVDARDNAERLLAMINRLLDLARLEQGRSQLRLRPERPLPLLQSAAAAYQPRTTDQGVELVVEAADDLPLVAVDADQLQHALQNLLDNALTHTSQGGRITLAAEAASGKLVFSVTDTGSGIPVQYLPFVFEKYFRVPGETSPGGSGLGLAIVREIAAAHGGTVECESRPGERTVFRLVLPISPTELARRADAP
jgi:two-component system, NtrC family, sensor histidine kinase KinB